MLPRSRESGLLGILQAGDLNPALRALLPSAIRSALHNDPDPLLRLDLLSEGLIPNLPSVARAEASQEVDEALFVDDELRGAAVPLAALRAREHAPRRSEGRAARRTRAATSTRSTPPRRSKPA